MLFSNLNEHSKQEKRNNKKALPVYVHPLPSARLTPFAILFCWCEHTRFVSCSISTQNRAHLLKGEKQRKKRGNIAPKTISLLLSQGKRDSLSAEGIIFLQGTHIINEKEKNLDLVLMPEFQGNEINRYQL